jgi:hypothetical protein
MNTEKLERWILLEESGELGALPRWRLQRELARSPAARKLAADYRTILQHARRPAEADVSDGVVATILAAARGQGPVREAKGAALGWRAGFAGAVAVAALALCVSLLTRTPPGSGELAAAHAPAALGWEDNLDASFQTLDDVFVMGAGDWNSGTASSETETLAKQLLSLEEDKI